MGAMVPEISGLSETEMRELMGQLEYELSRQDGNVRAARKRAPFTAAEDLLWEVICDTAGFPRSLAGMVAKKEIDRLQFAEAAACVDRFVAEACGGAALGRAQRRVLLRQLYGCLSDTLAEWNVPVVHRNLVKHTVRLAHAVEAAYPGYARAGLLLRVAVPKLPARELEDA